MDKFRVDEALWLLKRIETAGWKAIIAGGYVRDTICDKPIRDIDLYVSADDYGGVHLFLSGTHSFSEPASEGNEYVHQSIVLQEEFELARDLHANLSTHKINLIGLRNYSGDNLTVKNVINKFNLGICKAGIELAAPKAIVIGDEFRRDYKDQQITLYRTDWGHEATLKQFIKLQEKYPWPLRVTPKEEGLL